MRFDIDYARAKDMATRLQDFMSASPKKLTRSSAIEAIARTLGFNNRNEMAARIDAADPVVPGADAPEADAPEADAPEADPASSRDATYAAIDALLAEEIRRTARDLVAHGRKLLPRGDFRAAMHEEDPDEGIHTLMVVEDRLLQGLLADPRRRAVMTGALADNWELAGARKEGLEGPEALARALVNEAMEEAEKIWDSEAPGEIDDRAAIYQAAVGKVVEDLSEGARPDGDVRARMEAAAERLAELFGEPTGRVVADFRKGLIATLGHVPGDAGQAFDVDISAWVPGSLQVALPDDRVGEIAAEVLAFAVIQVEAADEERALEIARERIGNEDISPSIFNARPDRGTRKVRWASEAADGDPDEYVAREENLVEDHWEFDTKWLLDISANQIVES